jgi:hypothetical protein
MIDYKKLKLANELCRYLNNYCFEILFVGNSFPVIFLKYADDNGDNPKLWHMSTVDKLIDKLQELSQPQPKYKVGDQVWALDEGDIISFYITKIDGNKYSGSHFKNIYDCFWDEDYLYLSKEALIQAQIDHWKNLLAEEYEQDISLYCHPPFEGEIKGFE